MPQSKRRKVDAYLGDVVKPYRHREPESTRSEEETPVDGLSKAVI